MHVRRAWKRNGRGEFAREGEGRFYLGKPKNGRTRRLTLAPEVAGLLRQAVAGKRSDDLVFPAVRGGVRNQGDFYQDRWQPAVRAAQERGLSHGNVRFHDLRHTHAAWLISAGVPLTAVQHRLGHSSIVITSDVYGGLLVQPHEVADAAMSAVLSGDYIARPGPGIAAGQPIEPAADDRVALDLDDAALPEGGDDDEE